MMYNVLLLMTDQWRWDTVFAPGHACQVPTLRRFAREGVAFTRAYCPYPLCSPARASLFTGKWPHQAGLTDNVDRGSYYPHGKLHPIQKTYLERLRDGVGYNVSYSGKWHLGAGTLVERGITEARATDGALGGRTHFQPLALEGETLKPYYGSYSQGMGWDQYVIEQGMEQLVELAQAGQPFCSVISTPGPHFPHYVPKVYLDLYAHLPAGFLPANYSVPFQEEGKPLMQLRPYWPCQNTRPLTPEDWSKTCRHYWAYCTYLDDQFGRVLSLLDDLGLSENTVVAFCADHGEMLGAHGMFDKGPYFYEEIVHVPMIVRDPLHRTPRAPQAYVNLRDLFPTLISLAGAESILTDDERSRSFWETENACTFYCYDSYQGRQFKLRGIHAGRYKYNWSPNDLCELYDLAADAGERTNLADMPSYAELLANLHARLREWMEQEGDYLLCVKHLLPAGSYIDGRSIDEQHDPGYSDDDLAWFRREQ